MKTGYKITTDLLNSSWYYLDSANIIHGPIAFSKLRELVINGVVEVTTKVSRDKVSWQQAGAVEAIGFDCIVVDASDTYQLYGPFATDFIDKQELSSGIPAEGGLFVRIGKVGDIVSAGGINASLQQEAVDNQHAIINKEQLEKLTTEKLTLEAELASLKSSSEQEKSSIASEKAALEASKAALEAELASIKSSSEQEKSNIASEKAALEASKVALEAELASLKSSSEQERTSITSEKAALEASKAALEAELASLKSSSEQEKSSITSEKAALEESKSALEAELVSLKSSTEQQQSSFTSEKLALEKSNDALKTELAEIKEKVEEYNQLTLDSNKQIDELTTTNTSLEESNASLIKELEAIKVSQKTNAAQLDELTSKNNELANQVKLAKEELEQAKAELLNAVKQAQNDLIKEQIRAEQAEAARQTFEAEAMRASTLERENEELISENKVLLQQKHELANSLSIARENLSNEQQRSQQLADAANQIKRRLARALNNVIENPAEEVLTLSANEHGEEFVVDSNATSQKEKPVSVNHTNANDQRIICLDENGEASEADKNKIKQAFSLEAQLQKELMLLRARRAAQASAPANESSSTKDNGKSNNRFWKLFFKR